MTSEPAAAVDGCYVWTWLPGAGTPVVAGRLEVTGSSPSGPVLSFVYGRSYLARPSAVSLFSPELPLTPGSVDPMSPVDLRRDPVPLASCLRDAAPDAWGRRVINLRHGGAPEVPLSELSYLLRSSSDRIGAVDFQESSTSYVPRGGTATREQLYSLLVAADLTDAGEVIPPDLLAAAGHGTSVGGARPKALLRDGQRHLVAKFSSSTDDRPVVKAEALGMLLAARAGIEVAPVEVVSVRGRDVLLVERFDRPAPDDGTDPASRRSLLSGLTILGVSELGARYASYPDLADAIASSFAHPGQALEQLFRRLVLNMAIGNNDDHLRNVAALWDGHRLSLAPAYDLTPQPRRTQVSTQAIGVTPEGQRASQLWVARAAAPAFRLTPPQAEAIIDHVVTTVREGFTDAADRARLTAAERAGLWEREILNPYLFYDTP
ncbi:MAG: HipA domain-containing protein [Actinomycetota bacterium]|nr:HipA domain-containing protein [Actinomycetota bacterium]